MTSLKQCDHNANKRCKHNTSISCNYYVFWITVNSKEKVYGYKITTSFKRG